MIGTVLRDGQRYGPGTGDEVRGNKTLSLQLDGAAAAVLLAMQAMRPGVTPADSPAVFPLRCKGCRPCPRAVPGTRH